MPDLIVPNQARFIKGRQAADIAQLLRSIMSYASSVPTGNAIVFLDQEKTYDRVSYDYSEPLSIVPSSIVTPYENSVYSHTSFHTH